MGQERRGNTGKKRTNDRTNPAEGGKGRFRRDFLTKDPRFAYHGVSFAERGSWHGWGLDHYGRTAFAGQGGSACGQKQCAAAAGSSTAVQRAGAAAKCAAPDRCGGLSCPAAGRGLHGGLAGRRAGGAGAAHAHRPCTGGRRQDAGIHPVLRADAGAAWAGEHRAAGGLPYRGKTHRPAFAGAGADGRAAAARCARTAYTVRPGGAAGRGDLS